MYPPRCGPAPFFFSSPFPPQRGTPERGASRAPEENLQVEHEGGGEAGLQRAAEGEGESAGQSNRVNADIQRQRLHAAGE